MAACILSFFFLKGSFLDSALFGDSNPEVEVAPPTWPSVCLSDVARHRIMGLFLLFAYELLPTL